MNEYILPPRRLGGFLDGDIQHALVLLHERIEALKAYMALAGAAPPGGTP